MNWGVALPWWAGLMLAVLLIGLIYLDFRSRKRKLRWVRIFCLTMIFISIVGLYTKPSITSSQISDKVFIVTNGSEQVVQDSLASEGFQLLTFEEYLLTDPNVSSVVVIGNGLEEWEMAQLSVPIEFLPNGSYPEGPVELSVDNGSVNSETTIEVRLQLEDEMDVGVSGPGIEPIILKASPDQNKLEFEVKPTIPGDFMFHMNGVRDQDTVFSEMIPVRIEEQIKKNILILSGAPSFEVRFLRNHLIENGFGMAERQQVSKDIFRQAFTNLENKSLSNLTPQLLREFKLVIIDEGAYDDLSRSEKTNLKAALRIGELGLVWMGGESDLVDLRNREEKSLTFVNTTGSQVQLSQSPFDLVDAEATLNFQEHRIGSLGGFGLGKVTVPELSKIYTLKLKGEHKLYSDIWFRLLDSSMGVEWQENKVELLDLPLVNQPVTMILKNPTDKVMVDGVRLSIQEKWYHPGFFKAQFWPKRSGWHEITWGDYSESFYVFDENDWHVMRSYQATTRTSLASQELKTDLETKIILKPISKWIFFLGFLLSFGFLWIEQRLG